MILPDLNLLVYTYNSDAPLHQQARRWWETCLDGCQPVAIAWLVALGFVRLMTSRAVLQRPMAMQVAMEVAIQHLGRWLERPSLLILQPGPPHVAILTSFCEAGVLQSALLTDAHIAALAIENQAVVHSNDSDFSRFAGLRWSNPLR